MALETARAKSLLLTSSDLDDLAESAAFLERECSGHFHLRTNRNSANLLRLCGQSRYVASSRFPRSTERVDPSERHITSYSDRRNSIRPLSSR